MNRRFRAIPFVCLVAIGPVSATEAIVDPCTLLTTAEVRQVFPDSKPGRLNKDNEKYGVVTCEWSYPTGVFTIVPGDGEEESAKEEARGWTAIFVDPLRSDAEKQVRYEVLPGVGDEAVAVAEREDKSKGFYQHGAILVVRRGKQLVSVLSTDLARRERPEALRILTDFGKAIAKRLN